MPKKSNDKSTVEISVFLASKFIFFLNYTLAIVKARVQLFFSRTKKRACYCGTTGRNPKCKVQGNGKDTRCNWSVSLGKIDISF